MHRERWTTTAYILYGMVWYGNGNGDGDGNGNGNCIGNGRKSWYAYS